MDLQFMTPKAKRFQKEYAIELLRIAEGDLQSAIDLNELQRGRIENILYLCQQAIEKSIKSVLIFLQKPIPMTHDLETLIVLLPTEDLPPHSSELSAFSIYASIRRYEEGYEEIEDEELLAAIQISREIIEWAKIKITVHN
jgi:HEPN domain-containing protein